MAVHYPFYDVEKSHIINLFNLRNSDVVNDFKNTLTISRLLNYLLNHGQSNYSDLLQVFDTYGYTNEDISVAIDKCFDYGLVSSNYGCKAASLDPQSLIEGSSIARFYMDILITRLFYLSFVSDDTPMPIKFHTNLVDKYEENYEHSHEAFFAKMSHSVDLFLQFIKNEEQLEKDYIKNTLRKNYENYLGLFGIATDREYTTIYSYISSKWNKNEWQKAIKVSELKKYI